MTALTDNPARAEEFGTRARVLPLHRCASALGTQIVAALRLRFRLRKREVVLKYARSECSLVSSKGCTLERLRKRTVVLKDASNKCASQVCPTRPPYKGTSLHRQELCYYTLFVKELRRKNLHGKAGKIFRALDNAVKLKSKHARSGFPPRALITKILSTTHSLLHVYTLCLIFSKYLLLPFVCTSIYLIYPLVDVSFCPLR